MKKILSLILAGLMTVSCAAFVAADDAAVEATTDPVQDYAIEFLANCGVFKGGEGLTNEDLIQRYQMALFVSRISTGWVEDSVWEDGTANDATFKDIDTEPANKYLGALSYANQNGIIEGYTANTFAPYASITYRDALTMVVRTLGYKGLSYPWGNIEKAVELGLTEGIDAAYTDELTRGEVAVIIYNAMFANTAKGESLAKSIFGYDFGWQNIVIVSTDEYSLVDDTKKGEKVYAPADYVGFKTISENGVIGDKVYYILAADLGLSGNAKEQAVGEIFLACFEYDKDIAELVGEVASLKIATVMNNGITDNEGKAYETMPIAAALKDYKVVTDYTTGKMGYTYEDLKVFGYSAVELIDVDGKATYVGIDEQSNIVEYITCDTAKHGTDGHVCGWQIAWFYNAELDRYYDYIVKDTTLDTKLTTATDATVADGIAINWMSKAEFDEWYNKVIKNVVASYDQLNLLNAVIVDGKAPYAKIDLFDLDLDDKDLAEVANYKTYSIGLFSNDSKECGVNANNVNHADGKKYPTYKITGLDGAAVCNIFVEEGHTAHDSKTEGFGWLTVDPSVTTFDATKAAATGEVVLYNYNKTTGEIEIVKHITAGTNDDADSKIITGVLQGYSTSKKTVTIDGTVYPYDYANLTDIYDQADTKPATRIVNGAKFDEQYMQYISAVICDNIVVDTDLVNEDTSNVIVVVDYAGITSDGYIAVYGYKTSDLKLSVYKINSYNGWKKGDYRYYPANAAEDKAFEPGSLYTIRSWDKETDSYGVYTENVDTILENAVPVRITFDRGYRIVTPMTFTPSATGYTWANKKDAANKDVVGTAVEMTTADKYVIVDDEDIFVKEGIVDGKDVIGKDAASYIYSIDALMVASKLDASSMVLYTLGNLKDDNGEKITIKDAEFANDLSFALNAYDIGYVVYEKTNGAVLDAHYDEAIGGTYLLGSTMSEVRVFNLLTGDVDYVIASSNIDLEEGCLYKTIGKQIIGKANVDYDVIGKAHAFIDAIASKYASKDLDYADYIVANDVVLTKATLTKPDLAKALGMTTSTTEPADVAIANKLIHNDFAKKIFTWTDSYEWDWTGHDSALVLTAKSALDDNTTYIADIVYEVASGKVVIYIDANTGSKDIIDTKPAESKATVSLQKNYYINGKDTSIVESDLKAVVDYKTTKKADGTVDKTYITGLTLKYDNVLECIDNMSKGYNFGVLAQHEGTAFGALDSNLRVMINGKYYDFDSSATVTKEYLDITNMDLDTEECCNAVVEIYIPLNLEVTAVSDLVELEVAINDHDTTKFTKVVATIGINVDSAYAGKTWVGAGYTDGFKFDANGFGVAVKGVTVTPKALTKADINVVSIDG